MKQKTKIILIALLAAVLIGTVFYFLKTIHLQEKFELVLAWTKNQGWRAPIFFFIFYIFTAGIILPLLPYTIAAGMLFGTINGTLLILLSHISAALIIFFIARSIGSSRLTTFIASKPQFQALDQAIADNGWKIIAMVRNTPIFSSTLVNYTSGLTRISWKSYLAGTLLGIFPGTLMYCYIGDLSRHALSTDIKISWLEWAMLAFGLIATVVLMIVMARMVKRTLKKA